MDLFEAFEELDKLNEAANNIIGINIGNIGDRVVRGIITKNKGMYTIFSYEENTDDDDYIVNSGDGKTIREAQDIVESILTKK